MILICCFEFDIFFILSVFSEIKGRDQDSDSSPFFYWIGDFLSFHRRKAPLALFSPFCPICIISETICIFTPREVGLTKELVASTFGLLAQSVSITLLIGELKL